VSALLASIGQLERLVMPFAYVSNSGADSVTPINLLINAASPSIAVGDNPTGIGRQPGSTLLWVANTTAHTISVIDTLSNTVVKTFNRDLGLGSDFSHLNKPQSVAFNSSGTRAYVGGYRWFGVFDTARLTPVISKDNIGNGDVRGIAVPDAGEVLFAIVGGSPGDPGSVFEVTSAYLEDPENPPGSQPRDLSFDANAIMATRSGGYYYLHTKEGQLNSFRLRTGRIGEPYQIRAEIRDLGGSKITPGGIAINQVSKTAYVLTDSELIVLNLDPGMANTITLTKHTRLRDLIPGLPSGGLYTLYLRTASNRDLLYVVIPAMAQVAVIDPGTAVVPATVVATIPVSTEPAGITGP